MGESRSCTFTAAGGTEIHTAAYASHNTVEEEGAGVRRH